jgi:hypothetical protein
LKTIRYTKLLPIVFTAAAFSSALTVAQGSDVRPVSFLVRVSQGETDLAPNGLNNHDCILVWPDGRYHLEIRVQHPAKSGARLQIFESSLDSAQFQQLKNIIDNPNVRRLPPYAQPSIPMIARWYRGFHATIPRGDSAQSIGYWQWREGDPEASPNSMSKTAKEAWRNSEVVLRPLTEWLRGVESTKPAALPDARSTFCGEETKSHAE